MHKNSMLRILRNWRKAVKAKKSVESENVNLDLKMTKESVHFLNIFPELVWKCIAKHLDCTDFHNLVNSSPFFRNLLKDTRAQRLFKNVFEIMLNTEKYSISQEKEVKAIIFNCRLACWAWNKSLGDLVEKQFVKSMSHSHSPEKYTAFQALLNRYQFKRLDKFDNFIKKFGSSTSNPFFGKSIFLFVPPICHPDLSNNQQLYDKILFILELFGKYIYNCQVRLITDDRSRSYCINSDQTYLNLLNILWAMPNLKHLRIFQFSSVLPYHMRNVRFPPTLEKLESLELHSVSRAICYAMVRRNFHVRRLFIHQSFDIDCKAGYLIHPFKYLEHIELKHYNWTEICYLKDNNVNWKLKSLKLQFYANDDGKDFFRVNCSTVWADIFNILSQRFGETLEDLRLELPEMTNERNRAMVAEYMLDYRLSFPKLKKIDLIVGNYSPVDFLLGISDSLETLIVTFSLSDHNTIKNLLQVERKDDVKIYSCFCERCLLKLWKLFPELKTVQMRDSKILKFNRQE